ncbi:restriction endonuclease subunit S [Vibrio navarrensis]
MNDLPEEFARFPAHWKVLPFIDAVKDATSGNKKLPKQKYSEEGIYPIVDQGQAQFGGYTDEESLLCKSSNPTIVFGDHTRAFKYVTVPFVLGADGAKVLEPKIENLDKRFLFHYLKQLNIESAGYSRHFKFLKETFVPVPPLDEQKNIAAILDKADDIRQKRKQAIDLADEFLRSVFLDMFGDPVTNPKGWEIKTIGELATKVTDGEHQTPKREEKGYKLLSARNVQHGFLDVENEKVDYVGEAEFQRITKRLSISKSDVLLSCSGTIGRVSMNTLNEPFCLVRSVAVIRLADNGVIPEFLVGYLGTSAMQAIMKKEANSSGQPNLFQNQIKQLKVLVPPLELQAKYKRFLDHYKEKKASLISANEQQALLFKSLSQKAFSGQL